MAQTCIQLAAHTIVWSNDYKLPVVRPCGTVMHYVMQAVKEMGQQMGYHSLKQNWPKQDMNTPIWAAGLLYVCFGMFLQPLSNPQGFKGAVPKKKKCSAGEKTGETSRLQFSVCHLRHPE